MVESSNEFSLLLVFEEISFGVILKKIKYEQLVAYVKKKFKFSDAYDVMFTYQLAKRVVHIVDDDDVKFLVQKCSSSKGTEHTLFIKRIEKPLNSKACSSNIPNFDLNVPLFSNNKNFPKDERVENDKINETLWPKNTLNFIPIPLDPPPNMPSSSHTSVHASRILKKGDKFESKEDLKYEIGLKAMLDGYEFKIRKTDKSRYDVICTKEDCNWKIISSKCKGSNNWVIGTIHDHHTCAKTQIGMSHRNATAKNLGRLIEPKFKDENRVYRAKDIKNDIYTELNIGISYKKAWRAKNVALESLSGCPVASFAQLPFFCHNFELVNDGNVTHIETDNEDRFKMVFIAFGVVIRSFKNHMRPLIIIDAAHLKGRYEGTNLLAVGMDGNNQIIPIATGISQCENGPSWTLFMSKLKECLGDIPGLSIISDRHAAIKSAVLAVYPNAFHGCCCRHLFMNCKLKGISMRSLFWKMCKTYSTQEFNSSIRDFQAQRPDAYQKVIDAGVEKWSRAYCPADRYNYMTSNSAESINSLTKNVRKIPVTNLMEWYRALVQDRYLNRREKYKDAKENELSDWATAKITKRLRKSVNWIAKGIEMHRVYEVDDRREKHTVEFFSGTCTCRKWQLSGLPCGHVISAAKSFGVTDFTHLAKGWFRSTVLKATYEELVYPLGEVSSWLKPNDLQVVNPPILPKKKSGGQKGNSRFRSQDEDPLPTRCGRCGARGHNRNSCREAIPHENNYSDHDQQQGNYNSEPQQHQFNQHHPSNYYSEPPQQHNYHPPQNFQSQPQHDHLYQDQRNYNYSQHDYNNSQPFSCEAINLNDP